MGINFNDRILVANETTHALGKGVLCVGIVLILIGVVTYFTNELVFSWSGWIAFGIPLIAIGLIMIVSSLRKN